MDFNDYQRAAHETAQYPSEQALTYLALGLVGEAGEIANKVKKVIRDDGGKLDYERENQIIDEIGDVLWYAAELARHLGWQFGAVAAANLDKLQARARAGTINGDGDRRE